MNYGFTELLQLSTESLTRGWLLLAQTENGQGDGEGVAEAANGAAAAPVADPALVDPALVDPAGAGPAAGGSSFLVEFFGNPLNLILISGVLFIMLVLRPQQKQMKELQRKLAGLKKNDRVVTASGIHGTVVQASAEEPVVILRIDDNSGARMTVNRDAISKILSGETKENKD